MKAWLIQPDVLAQMRLARQLGYQPTLEERARFEVAIREAYAANPAQGPRNLRIAGSQAEILVEGVLTEKPDCFALLFGGGNTTYESIRAALAAAEADPAVKAAQMTVRSPGGTVEGLFETFAALDAFSKPLIVRAGFAASAAYGLSAVAGPIQATTPAAQFGSIGVATTYFVDEHMVDIASTEAPNKRPDVTTEEGKATVREQLDALHDQFVLAIAKGRSATLGRDVTAKEVNADYGRGAMIIASDARKVGMIDGVPRKSERNPARASATVLEDLERPEGPAPATTEETPMNKQELKDKHPEVYAAIVAEGRAEGVTAGEKTERDRCVAHLTMGEASGDMKTATEAIKSGEGMTATVQAKYMSAGMKRSAVSDRQAESDAAGAAVGGTPPAPPVAAPANPAAPAAGSPAGAPQGDLGDQVVAELEKRRGKKPSTAATV